MLRQLDVMPLANKPCESCGKEPAWYFPVGDCLCAPCFHNGVIPKQVKAEIRANVKKTRQHPEADFQQQIIDLARHLGYEKVAHFRPAMNRRGQWMTPVAADGAGFPDLLLVRGERWDSDESRLVFVEVKGAKGKLSDAQREWNSVLVRTKAEVYTWRVGKITLEEIVEILR